MQVEKQVLYIYTETPLHVGIGTGLGAVDMPIQREKHTNYPIVQASGVKGALRDTAERKLGGESQEIRSIFGGASGSGGEGEDGDFAGAVSPSDARILLFPVRALNGVFVWVTSVSVLERFKRETGVSGAPNSAQELSEKAQISHANLKVNEQVMLEEYAYQAEVTETASEWAKYLAKHAIKGEDYWKTRLETHLVILPDNDFRDFVTYSTEIVTRVHIDDELKTVKDGQLFTQELLPADSLLYSVVVVTDTRDKKARASEVVSKIQDAIGDRIQIGGNETVGRGRVVLGWQGVSK